jgi:KaiC domain protein
MDVLSTGVDGLDAMLDGGVPRGHALCVLGSFGTGKTTFALQFVTEGLMEGDKAIFVTLEEDVDSIVESARKFGWDLQKFLDKKTLAVYKLEPADLKATVSKVRTELPEFLKKFGAGRVAIDSISLLSAMFPDEAERRSRLFSLARQMREGGATAVFTAETRDDNPKASRDGLVEYVADGVISLRLQERANGEVQPLIQVVKMRRVRHQRRVRPYNITEHGIVVLADVDIM